MYLDNCSGSRFLQVFICFTRSTFSVFAITSQNYLEKMILVYFYLAYPVMRNRPFLGPE